MNMTDLRRDVCNSFNNSYIPEKEKRVLNQFKIKSLAGEPVDHYSVIMFCFRSGLSCVSKKNMNSVLLFEGFYLF